jgi:predicted metal-dependent hydrolase
MDGLLRQGIIFFDTGRYFEAHEVWEDLWRGTSPGSVRLLYQGLIQGAVGMHHLSRGNMRGARAQLTKALEKLQGAPVGTCPEEVFRIARYLRKALESLKDSGGMS